MSNSITSLHPLIGPASSLMLSTMNITTNHLFLPLLLPLHPSSGAPLWAGVYRRGLRVAIPAAVFSSLACFTSAYLLPANLSDSSSIIDAKTALVINGVMTLSNMAWTIAFMLDTNARLCELADGGQGTLEKAGEGEVQRLIAKWGWMNGVRASLVGVGAAVGLVGVCGKLGEI